MFEGAVLLRGLLLPLLAHPVGAAGRLKYKEQCGTMLAAADGAASAAAAEQFKTSQAIIGPLDGDLRYLYAVFSTRDPLH